MNRLLKTAGCVLLSTVLILSGSTGLLEAEAVQLSGGTQDYRNRIISVCGIAETGDTSAPVTRQEFAKMLVLASVYKDTVSSSPAAAAFDVPSSHPCADYIRIALRQGWMRTRVSGNFAPEEPVTLQDAAKAVLTMLGYSDSDFEGNINAGRLAKFAALELDEGVAASAGTDSLCRLDCINILYNLLGTSSKSSQSIYGSFMDLSLQDDGELNASKLLETSMVGPVLVKTEEELKACLPFDINEATLYLNGTNSGSTSFGLLYYGSALNTNGWLIIYYNESSKTVWAYGTDRGTDLYHCIRGTVTSIVYNSANIVSPSSVCVDGTEYELSTTDVRFQFSVNGSIKVGDMVVLITQSNSNANADTYMDNASDYYVVGVVKYSTGDVGVSIGTRYTGASDN